MEVAITLYAVAGIIALIAYISYKADTEISSPEEKFKKIYHKKKDNSKFFLCDYCTKCEAKYTYHNQFNRVSTKYILSDDCPFVGESVKSAKVCSKFELDKNKI